MKPTRALRQFLATALCVTAAAFSSAHENTAPLTAAQKTFLTRYEAVRAALVADDLAAAKTVAGKIVNNEHADKLAAAGSIAEAREAFRALSKRATHLTEKQPGYFTVHCPMVKDGGADWVQTTKTINNPYFGKSMLTCGSIKE